MKEEVEAVTNRRIIPLLREWCVPICLQPLFCTGKHDTGNSWLSAFRGTPVRLPRCTCQWGLGGWTLAHIVLFFSIFYISDSLVFLHQIPYFHCTDFSSCGYTSLLFIHFTFCHFLYHQRHSRFMTGYYYKLLEHYCCGNGLYQRWYNGLEGRLENAGKIKIG